MLAHLRRWLIVPSAGVPDGERRKVTVLTAVTLVVGLAIVLTAFAGTPASRPTLRIMIAGIVPAYVLCRTRWYRVGAVLTLVTISSFGVVQVLVDGQTLDQPESVFHRFAWLTLTVAMASLFFSARGVLLVALLSDAVLLGLGLLAPNVSAQATIPTLVFISLIGLVLYIDTAVRERRGMELEAATRAAQSATRAKSEFLSNMSHELRTPLNAIIGMAEILLDCELAPEHREHAEVIHVGGQRLMTIINDILDVSRIESARLQLAREPFAVRACVDASVRELVGHDQSENREVEVEVVIADDVPDQVVGDRLRVQQILRNLVGNALKFTERGRVTIAVVTAARVAERDAAPTRMLHFSVVDTGIGIAPEVVAQLFRPFVQADTSSTRRYGGTGLGLAICKHLVELMEGDIWVESELGKGTTFHVTLPADLAPDPVPTVADDQQRANGFDSRMGTENPLRILVVEDNPLNRKVVVRMLGRLGYSAAVSDHGGQALDALARASYDVVLMDIHMPEMDGLEASRRIRANTALVRQPRIIALTAGVLEDAREQALAAGMDDYLAKPVSVAQLAEALRACRGPEFKGDRDG